MLLRPPADHKGSCSRARRARDPAVAAPFRLGRRKGGTVQSLRANVERRSGEGRGGAPKQRRSKELDMKSLIATAVVAALALGAAGTADAQRFETRYDRARVIDVDRVYAQGPGRVVQECWNERTRRYDAGYYRDDRGRLYRSRDNGTEGALIGALIGGALGNQVGDGSGRTAATIAGAIAGGAIGKNVDEGDDYRYRSGDDYRYRTNDGVVTRCRTTQTSGYRRDGGFRVTYVYNGMRGEAYMRNHPGRTIPVEVDVREGRRGRVAILDVRPRGDYVADYDDWRD
jgi:uncharacterized protein YcfJ